MARPKKQYSPTMTILVLEDERALQAAIKSKLESEGFSVVTTKTVNQALDYLKEGVKIDAVWLDHYLFDKESGLDFVTEIKESKQWEKIPLFVVSNTVSQEKLELYRNLGVQKFYAKVDYRLDTIVADIKKYLGARKA